MSSLHIGGSTYVNEILHSHYLATARVSLLDAAEGAPHNPSPRPPQGREIQQTVVAVTRQQRLFVTKVWSLIGVTSDSLLDVHTVEETV